MTSQPEPVILKKQSMPFLEMAYVSVMLGLAAGQLLLWNLNDAISTAAVGLLYLLWSDRRREVDRLRRLIAVQHAMWATRTGGDDL